MPNRPLEKIKRTHGNKKTDLLFKKKLQLSNLKEKTGSIVKNFIPLGKMKIRWGI